LIVAVLTSIALHCLSGFAQAQVARSAKRSAQNEAESLQNDLARRISAANAAQTAGKPAAIAKANERLLAAALRLMGQLRVSEGAYAKATELYRASLDFESSPDIHGELAMAAQLAGNQDEAIKETKIALASDQGDAHLDITLGRAYIAKKDYAAANRALTEASRMHPDINTLYLLATSWLAEGQPDARRHADRVFEQMEAVAGDSGSLHVLMGRAYRDAGLMPDAVNEFKRAIALDPATPHAHYFLGLASLAMNEWQPTPLATAEMEKELQYHPDDYLSNYMLGFLASTQHQYAAADEYLKAAVGMNTNWPEPFLYLGLDAFAEGDNQTAETMLRKAVELTGSDESRSNYQIRRAYVDLGRILAKSGRQQEADVFAAKARDLENQVMRQTQQNATAMLLAKGGKSGSMAAVMPLEEQANNRGASIANASADAAARLDAAAIANSSLTPAQREAAKTEEDTLRPILGQSYSDLATAEAIQHDYQSALKYYQAAEQWKPDISELAKNLGQAAYRAGNYPEAVRGLSAAIKENPDSMPLRAMLGMSYFEMKDYGNAATTFYPLGEAAMRDPAVGYAWADSLAKTGDLKDASQVLAIYQNSPLPSDAMLLVGQLWAEIGDYERAVSTLHQVLALDPSFPKVHYDIALAEIRAERWSEAGDELNAQLAITPSDPDSMFNLGFVDLQESKKDDARKLFEQVIAKNADHADAQYQLGKLLMEQGNVQEALPHLEAAARSSPDKDYVHYQLQAAYRRLSRPADADRELAVYEQIKAKSRADSRAAVNQTLQQKE
jgi:tetratricopeptide (TPR) repeat protein